MLVQFSVENFRVFETKQTISLVADTNTSRKTRDPVLVTEFEEAPALLRQACILGANGAGKTSLIEAIAFMKQIVRNSVDDSANDRLNIEPFFLKAVSRKLPSVFEIVFIEEGTLYEYGFAYTTEMVTKEWLTACHKTDSETNTVFTREYNEAKSSDYEWYLNPDYINGDENFWKTSTLPKALFLSFAVRLNLKSLVQVYNWIDRNLVIISNEKFLTNREYTARLMLNEGWKKKIVRFLNLLDIEFVDIIVQDTGNVDKSMFNGTPRFNTENHRQSDQYLKSYDINFVRMDDNRNPISFPLQYESSGTISLFDMAGPLIQSIEGGHTILIDELNTPIHPLAFQSIVSMFENSQNIINRCQIIFTTHDVSILEHESIQRDQVWFAERESDYSSNLHSFLDLENQSPVPISKRYLSGQFGGIPLIP